MNQQFFFVQAMIGRRRKRRVRYEWGDTRQEALTKLLSWARGHGNVQFTTQAWATVRPFAEVGDQALVALAA